MGAPSVKVPFPTFESRSGAALNNGRVYIGVANVDPVTNPIQVYWDGALTVPAAQPIITTGGYLFRDGTPANVFVNGDYSITVKDNAGNLVYNAPSAFAAIGSGQVQDLSGNGTQTTFAVNFSPNSVFINGVYQNRNTYSITGGNIIFTQAPPFNSNIELVS